MAHDELLESRIRCGAVTLTRRQLLTLVETGRVRPSAITGPLADNSERSAKIANARYAHLAATADTRIRVCFKLSSEIEQAWSSGLTPIAYISEGKTTCDHVKAVTIVTPKLATRFIAAGAALTILPQDEGTHWVWTDGD